VPAAPAGVPVEALRATGAEVVFDAKILPASFAKTASRVATYGYVQDGMNRFLAAFGPAADCHELGQHDRCPRGGRSRRVSTRVACRSALSFRRARGRTAICWLSPTRGSRPRACGSRQRSWNRACLPSGPRVRPASAAITPHKSLAFSNLPTTRSNRTIRMGLRTAAVRAGQGFIYTGSRAAACYPG
jgi:hypothetical protein